eukprot:jgi/Galph1/2026/GphlegSOOS_G728.1
MMHDQYTYSLKTEDAREDFVKMLRILFVGDSIPSLNVCEGAYQLRDLLSVMNDRTLRWTLCLFQLASSSFPEHNKGSADIQRLFYPPEKPQLVSLLESIFDDTGFEVSVIRDDSNQIVDFEVLNPFGVSCRNRIRIIYVTSLYESDAGISFAPKFVDFISFEKYHKSLQQLLVMQPEKKAKRKRLQRL